jgi:thiosulfate/3-mercaptopyruvate sulfurtransferase
MAGRLRWADMSPLVDVDWLRERLGAPGLVVVDCRFKLGEPGAGERDWLRGHIPGAPFLDVDRDLAAEPGDRGRHPLPEPAAFEAAARRAGIGGDSVVVAYDDAGEGGAVRLWWLLRHFGHERAAVLNGGLRAWREAGGPLRAREEELEHGDFVARAREDDTAAAEELAHGDRLLFDARAPERFRGEVEPIDPVAGHIPGAVNVPFAEIAPQGHFPAPEELRVRLEAAGAGADREVVAYCGSGVTACTLVLAAELAGLRPARLYPGSWSEWSGRGYPVARQESARSTESRKSGPGGVRSR